MNRNASFIRKLIYLAAIALLLIPLSYLCQPSAIVKESGGEDGEETTVRVVSGGKLAQLRADNGLSQAQLGEVDPAGETLKLATLGLRGVAANILWGRAQEYKKTENWGSVVGYAESDHENYSQTFLPFGSSNPTIWRTTCRCNSTTTNTDTTG